MKLPLPRALRAWCAACLCLLAAALAPAGTEAADFTRSIFRSSESRNDSIRPFVKWVTMLERKLEQQLLLDSRGCGFGPYESCGPYYWRQFLHDQNGKLPLDQIDAVNTYVNKFTYVLDQVNWNVADFWETPLEFLEKHGDCEDFAITKYVTLKALGFDAADMRIVAVQDLSLDGAGHAVLLLRFGGKDLVLDNQVSAVTTADKVLHYRAIFSINEQHWWKHVYLN